MIPVRITLKNFLSYGDAAEPLELDGVHVACLCGNNGHGKSALLDAITWALWGQARVNSADDLIRQSQSSMEVDLEFDLDGQRYRVVRRRTRGRSGQSDLQLQIFSDLGWRAMTEAGVRQTQDAVVRLLRMDYDTFINSAFILQGRADEFSRRTAGERKRILGEILNLGQYDELTQRARLRGQECETRRQGLEVEIGRIEAEVRQEPELTALVETLTQAEKDAQLKTEQARAEYNRVMIAKAEMDARRSQRADLARRLQSAEAELRPLRSQLAQAQVRVEASRTVLAKAVTIREQYESLQLVRGQLEAHRQQLQRVRELERRRQEAERIFQAARQRVVVDLEMARKRVRDLMAREELQPQLREEAARLEEQVRALDSIESHRAEAEEERRAATATRAEAQGRSTTLRQQLEELDERFAMLKAADSRCPVCEGDLTMEKRRDLGWKCRSDREETRLAIEAAEQEMAACDARLKQLAASLATAAQKLRSGQEMRSRLAKSQQVLFEIEEALKELPPARELIALLEGRLNTGEFAPETRAEVERLNGEIQALGYDEDAYAGLEAQLKRLTPAESEFMRLQQAEAALPADEAQCGELEGLIAARENALLEDRAALAVLDQQLTRAAEVDAEALRLERECRSAESAQEAAIRTLSQAQQALAHAQAQKAVLKEKRAERDVAARERAIFDELGKAFGRNGIQASIIQNAIPELQQDANEILARMTENELRVAFRTQKETKSGTTTETLEIDISDGAGTRRYELFSGGEAFRVNFAIRIALSKLLARRAGARLETLVIDEGFGSQDTEGRWRLVEAIQAIQDQFARILVVTHLDDLKDAFPTRIEVVKTATGSRAMVV